MVRTNGRIKTVLVVEDNDDDRFLLERAVQKSPCAMACQFVESVATAKAYLKGNGRFSDRTHYPLPDLLLLDAVLPDGGGLSLLEWIRCSPAGKSLKVCVWTGSPDPTVGEAARRLGANWIVQKETDPEIFSGVVSQMARAITPAAE